MKNKDLANRVKTLRKNAGLTQSELAEKSGIGFRTIQSLESGGGSPTVETLQSLAGAMDIPIVSFFDSAPGERKAPIKCEEINLSASARVLLAFEMAPQPIRDAVEKALSGVDLAARLSQLSQVHPVLGREKS